MILKKVSYVEFQDSPQEWRLDELELGQSNLLVGKNASGKTRALNVISGLARYLSGLSPISVSGSYVCEFHRGNDVYKYSFDTLDQKVTAETLSYNDNSVIERGAEGKGTIWADKLGLNLEFQSPTESLTAAIRRDAIQHPFLEPLYEWASTLRHYTFGTPLGKETMAHLAKNALPVDAREQNTVVGLFLRAKKEYPEVFIKRLIGDFSRVGYDINSIDVGAPVSIQFIGLPMDLVGLNVQETALPGVTDQFSMSQGMFRALSLLIHMNYCQLSNTGSTVLIDDIGEGLDFDRSCRLIELLREKALGSAIQLVMSTNDRFVMNQVPLDEWSVLQRDRGTVHVRNVGNSRDIFESFKFTGLSNFSFLEMDFINTGVELSY